MNVKHFYKVNDYRAETLAQQNGFESDSVYLIGQSDSTPSSGTVCLVDTLYVGYSNGVCFHARLYSNGILEQYECFAGATGTSLAHVFPIPFSDNRVYVSVTVALNSNGTGGVNVNQCPLDSGTGAAPWTGTSTYGDIRDDNNYHNGRMRFGFRISKPSSADRQYHVYARGVFYGTSLRDAYNS